MKKHNLIIVIFLVVAGIIFIKMSDSKEIKKINVYLESYDINIFDKNNVISISDNSHLGTSPNGTNGTSPNGTIISLGVKTF